MKTKKKLSVFFVCVAMAICLGCAFGLTACGSNKDLTYTLNDAGDGYCVSVASRDIKKVKIPSKHKGLPVTEIHDFVNCTSLKSVTIPNSVTYIRSDAFYGCTALTSITIPDSVTELGARTFRGCGSLKSAELGSGITELGAYLFQDCWALTSVTFTSSVKTIDNTAFKGCSSLTDIYFKGGYNDWKNIYTYDDINWAEETDVYFKAASVHYI